LLQLDHKWCFFIRDKLQLRPQVVFLYPRQKYTRYPKFKAREMRGHLVCKHSIVELKFLSGAAFGQNREAVDQLRELDLPIAVGVEDTVAARRFSQRRAGAE
jgi:hypothetical protein